jgi:hypothetical protein
MTTINTALLMSQRRSIRATAEGPGGGAIGEADVDIPGKI